MTLARIIPTIARLPRLRRSVLLPLFRALGIELLVGCVLVLLSIFAVFSILQWRDRQLAPPRGLS